MAFAYKQVLGRLGHHHIRRLRVGDCTLDHVDTFREGASMYTITSTPLLLAYASSISYSVHLQLAFSHTAASSNSVRSQIA